MFDFQNLRVYQKAKEQNKLVLKFLKQNKKVDPYIKDQLKRASISIVINIAEGSGKFSKADKRNFYTIARGSVYECVSLIELIKEDNLINAKLYDLFYENYVSLSKMLLGLVNIQK